MQTITHQTVNSDTVIILLANSLIIIAIKQWKYHLNIAKLE